MRLAPLIFMGFWLLSDGAIARQVDPLRFAIIKDVPSTAAAEALLRSAYRELGVEITTHRLPSRRALMSKRSFHDVVDLLHVTQRP